MLLSGLRKSIIPLNKLLGSRSRLDGLSVTTHWEDINDLSADYPALQVVDHKYWVCDGKYITSGGNQLV